MAAKKTLAMARVASLPFPKVMLAMQRRVDRDVAAGCYSRAQGNEFLSRFYDAYRMDPCPETERHFDYVRKGLFEKPRVKTTHRAMSEDEAWATRDKAATRDLQRTLETNARKARGIIPQGKIVKPRVPAAIRRIEQQMAHDCADCELVDLLTYRLRHSNGREFIDTKQVLNLIAALWGD